MVIPQQILPMVIGRILTGFTAGIASVIVPIYITEISREPLRGPLGVIPNIASSLGIMLAYALGWTAPVFIKHNIAEYGCDILLAIPAVMNLLRIINLVLFFDFETPFYLLQEKQKAEAKSTLGLLYEENISDRLDSIVLEQEYIFEEKEKDIPFRELFNSKFRRIFLFALFLAFGRQFTGVNIILSFSNMIFAGDSHSLDSKLSLTLTTIIGVLNLLFSFAAIPLLTNFGRRTLTIASLALLAGLQILIGLIIYFDSISNAFVHFLLFVVICVAELSIGAILFIYVAETLPETAVGLVILMSWITSFLVTQFFMSLQIAIGYSGVFLLAGGIVLVTCFVSYIFMVESKGRTRLEILKIYTSTSIDKDDKADIMEKVNLFPSLEAIADEKARRKNSQKDKEQEEEEEEGLLEIEGRRSH